MNNRAFKGLVITMSKKPITAPTVGPIIGTKEVMHTKTEMISEFGIEKILIPIKQSVPRIKDSNNCPPIKREKDEEVLWAI